MTAYRRARGANPTGPAAPDGQPISRLRRVAAALGALLALVLSTVVLAPPAAAVAAVSVQKQADATTVDPGQTFNYTIQVQCSTATDPGCTNAVLTDPLPQYILPNGPVTVTGTDADPMIDQGPPITVTFQDQLPDGTTGLLPGEIVTITVPVVVDPTIPATQNGVPIDNTATMAADNADPRSSTARVTPNIPELVAAATTKGFTPESQVAGSTDPITLSLTGTNASNVPVDTLVIQDPAEDPPAAGEANPFFYLALTDVGTPTLPPNADEVTIEVYDPAVPGWVGAEGADLATATGVRYTFTDTSGDGIQPNAQASVELTLAQRPGATPPIVVTNTVLASVARGDQTAEDTDEADFNIRESTLSVDATKTIDPESINAGEPATVTLGAVNGPDPLTSMTITEPAEAANNPFTGTNAITFTGFGAVEWPLGATAAEITYQCSETPIAPISTDVEDTLPPPPDGCVVTGFTVVFTGAIVAGAEAEVPFTIDTPEEQSVGGTPVDELTRLNVIRVDGTDGTSSASSPAEATLVTFVDRIAVQAGKVITPESIPGRPGQIAIVQLEGQLLPFPDSTVDATTIVVQEPSTLPDPNGWFAAFAPQSVTATPVPGCSTLTVQYTTDPNGAEDSWQDVPGMVDIAGPTIVNEAFPTDVEDNATGIRFVYTADPAGGTCEGGFPPGTSVAPNLAFGVRPDGPASLPEAPVTVTDCTDTAATAATVDPVTSAEACDQVVVNPVPDYPVGVDPLDKAWDLDLLNARSQQQAGAVISWSTQGYTGLVEVEIRDIPHPEATALQDSVYDVFDLVRIDPITPELDPHLVYDQIVATELFVLPEGSTDPAAGSWQVAPGDPCPTACDGTYPGYTVPEDLRERVIGFRLMYQESPTRGDRISAGAPPVGTGVAASSGNDRDIHPVFQLRDELRSDSDVPVIAEQLYNTATEGEINNEVEMEAVFDPADEPFEWLDNDTIQIVDVPVTVDSTKTWTGGPLGIPVPGVDQEDYPLSHIELTGTNTTPALIDELVITDDTAGDTFEWFNLVGFTEITPPEDIGADDVVITLTGLTPADHTLEEALALTEADLVDVTQVTVTYTGRININEPDGAGAAVVGLDLRLREFARSDGTTRPTVGDSPVDNQVTVDAADLVDYPDVAPVTAQSTADAAMQLVEQAIFVTASKTIEPPTQTEPDNSPVTVTIGGQPHGEAGTTTPPASRAVEMVLVDDDPRLWNQYDFVSLDDVTFTAPIDQVRVDALTGGTWEIGIDGNPVITGAEWQLGDATTGPTLELPDDVEPEDVQGLRFVFTRVDGANWENPSNPLQEVSFQVQRRENLNIDADGNLDTTPVPVDLPEFNDPAPGEESAGTATNTSTAQAISSDILPNGQPLTSEVDDATDTIVFQHATNSVAVLKTPNGNELPPGQTFTYTLESTNDGDVDIANPVITDHLPVDAQGPVLVLADPANFTFEFTGDAGMPTLPALVTVTDDSTDPTDPTLTFTFPEGSTLPIGETYTISFDVMTRPGFPADTDFTNEFGIVGDREWDNCTGVLDPETGECQASATNELSVAGAMGVTKLVQAEGSDELGVTTDPALPNADPAECEPNADGFYARPCIPIAEPGGDITWRLEFVNTGNLNIDRVLGIDTLPAIGDTLATVPALERGSEWEPTLTGERPVLTDPTFGTLNIWFTTGESTCDAVAPTVAGDATPPNLLCPDLDWQEWPEGAELPVSPDEVTGLQFEILPATVLAPAQTVDVDVAMVAPAFDPEADYSAPEQQPDKVTYNTVGTTGRILNSQGVRTSYTLPSEPPRVGVALATGPLSVVKVVSGDAAQWAPESFEATLSCVSAGVDVPIPEEVATLTLVPLEPQTINNLPWGAECVLTETAAGQTDTIAITATVVREDQPIATARLTNVYDDAPLTLTKTVDSDAVDADGEPIAYGPFTVTVTCTFLDGDVYADGYGPDTPMTFDLADGDSITLTGLPVGASCLIAETDTKGATSTTVEVVTADGETTTEGTEAAVELPEGQVEANVTNVFTVGSVEITKVVDGDTDHPGAAGPFTVAMTCTLDDESGSRVVWEGELVLEQANDLTQQVDNLATGAVCTFEETETGGAETVVIDPADGVTVGTDEVATVTVTNTFVMPPPSPTPSPTDPGDGGGLPGTGSAIGRVLWLAGFVLLAGLAVLLASRRGALNRKD